MRLPLQFGFLLLVSLAGGCASPWQTQYSGTKLPAPSERCDVQRYSGTMPDGYSVLGTSRFQWNSCDESAAAAFGRSIGADVVLLKCRQIAANEERGSINLYTPGQTGNAQPVGSTTTVPFKRDVEYWYCDGTYLVRQKP